MMPLPSKAQLLQEARCLAPNKQFGQHFLIDPVVLADIGAALLPGLSQPVHVVEVGGGSGCLTRQILADSRVKRLLTLELDPRMLAHLRRTFEAAAPDTRLRIVSGDALAFPWENAFEDEVFKTETECVPNGAPYVIMGNLPYHIATPLLFRWLGEPANMQHSLRARLDDIVVMVQREVAQRVVAVPGGKAWGPLAIGLQLWGTPQRLFDVPPSAFWPPPQVHSSVIRIQPRTQPRVPIRHPALFHQVVKAAFAQRRKTLSNALRPLITSKLPDANLQELLALCHIEPGRRAEQLPLETFVHLTDVLATYLGFSDTCQVELVP
jgi:16S rRNA (adenine1518-N6/adenine1519-N6)-dimethyltransferase